MIWTDTTFTSHATLTGHHTIGVRHRNNVWHVRVLNVDYPHTAPSREDAKRLAETLALAAAREMVKVLEAEC